MIYLLYNTSSLFFSSSPLLTSLSEASFKKRLPKGTDPADGFSGNPFLGGSIWVHAASVGEVFCSIPLLKRIKKEFPHCKIVLTTMTSTGNEAAKTQLPEADQILFFPIDHPFILRRVLKKIRPTLLLIAETELWPNLLRACGRKGIPIILFNGRISEKSFRGYLFFRFFFEECLKSISLFLMQTNEDQDRIIQIGAPSEKTRVVGNLKFDQALPSVTQEAGGHIGPISRSSWKGTRLHCRIDPLWGGGDLDQPLQGIEGDRSRSHFHSRPAPPQPVGGSGEDAKKRVPLMDAKDRLTHGSRPLNSRKTTRGDPSRYHG